MAESPSGARAALPHTSLPAFPESKRLGVAGVQTAAAPGSTEILWRSAFVVASLLVGYLGLEVAFAVVPTAGGPVLNVYNRTTTAGLDCYPTNPRGAFDLDLRDPATRQRFEDLRVRNIEACATYAPYAVELSYNSLQFRDREPGPRRPGVRRVAVLGDSFTEGQGVKEAEVYPRVLERALNTARGDWEVLNFGRRGADFPALGDTFDELLEFDPDVVVYGMGLNDCETSDEFRRRHPFVTGMLEGPRQKPMLEWSAPFGSRAASFVQRRVRRYRVDRAMRAWYGELYGERNREGWARTQSYIERMRWTMRLRGGHFLVATWPVLAHLDRDYPFRAAHETVGRFCHASGIAWVDLLPVLQGHAAEDLWVHPRDPHPNALGHALVGRSLALAVRRLAD